uniref:Uncharacterized protein n=1 Tax=Clytia hemisphaerica TaxID=252671 RepID=A0A7M5VF20_9CNID
MKRKQTDIQDFGYTKKMITSTPNKDKKISEKKDALSLSSHKVVYARDEDPADTLVIRSFYPDAPEGLRRFGMKGVDNIKKLLLAILKLLDEVEMNEVIAHTKFLTATQVFSLYDLVDEFKEEIEEMGFDSFQKTTGSGTEFTYVTIPNTNVRVGITITKKNPQICLFQDVGPDCITGIFLFMMEIHKLIKYMNTKFQYTEHRSFLNTYRSMDDSKDNFF